MRSFHGVLAECGASKEMLLYVGDYKLHEFWRACQFPSWMAWVIENTQHALPGMPDDKAIVLGARLLTSTLLLPICSRQDMANEIRILVASTDWNQSVTTIHDRLAARDRLKAMRGVSHPVERNIRWAAYDLLSLFDERRYGPIDDCPRFGFANFIGYAVKAFTESDQTKEEPDCVAEVARRIREVFPLHKNHHHQPQKEMANVEH